MGPRAARGAEGQRAVVYASGQGDEIIDVDGNRYVDFAAGFGSLLLGHGASEIRSAVRTQLDCLDQALGDLHPSDTKVKLLERLSVLFPGAAGQAILGQSGADAVTAALKTALLATGRPGVLAFEGAYHGLSHGPLSACGLRRSYREPFAAQLNPATRFVPYPVDPNTLDLSLSAVQAELKCGDVGAVLFEPIAGRAGCLVPPLPFAAELSALCRDHGALLVADEIWTGLGRAGEWLYATAQRLRPDLICLGKGLGGGLPISACLGPTDIMSAWSREAEVVHTSTFAGAPLSCAAALATLDAVGERNLVARSARLGRQLQARLQLLADDERLSVRAVRGAGLMLAVELSLENGAAARLQSALLDAGYVVSLGGAGRESLVLTPALSIAEPHLEGLATAMEKALTRLHP